VRREWLNLHALWLVAPALWLLPASAAAAPEAGSCDATASVPERVRLIDVEAFLGGLASRHVAPGGIAADGARAPGEKPFVDAVPDASAPSTTQAFPMPQAAAVTARGAAQRAAEATPTAGPAPSATLQGGHQAPSGGPSLNVDLGAPTRSVADGRAEAAQDEEERPVFQIRARVLARGSADERRDFDRRLSLATGELGATASISLLEAELTADFADSAILKDAYVRLSTPSRDLRLYGGQFKSPFLARRLMSRWDLPTIQRGLVVDYLIDDHGLGGRRLGLMGEWRAKPLWNLRASLGVFEGGVDELGIRTGREDAAGRVAIRPIKPLTLGASGYLVSAFDAAHRAGAGAVDATLRLGGLSVSGEVTAGRIRPGSFAAQSALASWALPLDPAERWALEPVLGAEALQLLGPEGGSGYAYTAGLNLLFLDSFKAMLQGEHALRPGDSRPAFALFFQLAAQLSLE